MPTGLLLKDVSNWGALGLVRSIRVGWLAFFLICAPVFAAHAHLPHKLGSSKTLLLYSANDSLCGRLTTSLNDVHQSHPNVLYISEVRTAFFKSANISAPEWIVRPEPDLGNAYPDWGPGPSATVVDFLSEGIGKQGNLFFHADVANEGKKRLVYISNDAIGSHGDFGTTVWLLKPDVEVKFNRTLESHAIFKVIREEIDPEIIDLRINFIDRRYIDQRYPTATVPDRTIFPTFPRVPAQAQRLLATSFANSQLQEQDPFFDDGRLYFLAGSPFTSSGLVYQIEANMTTRVVCLMARRELLNYLHL